LSLKKKYIYFMYNSHIGELKQSVILKLVLNLYTGIQYCKYNLYEYNYNLYSLILWIYNSNYIPYILIQQYDFWIRI